MRRQSLKCIRTFLISIALGAVLSTIPATSALAIDTYAESQCSSGGFTGYFRVHYSYSPGSGSMTVRYYSYRINKGGNSGGNKANISVQDTGIMPARNYNLWDAGIQDNAYHVHSNPADYGRASNSYFNFRFTFDKSLTWPDPSCAGSFKPPSTF